LSSINPKHNGDFIPEIAKLFPNQEVFARKMSSFDAFEDDGTWNAFLKIDRKKLVVSGLWTSMCFAYTALHSLKEGYEVYGLIDAEGKNLTIDIYDPANHNCSINNTMVSYMDAAGHCVINGRHNPYETCKCQHPEPCGSDCTCTKDLTFLELMNRSLMFLGGKM
jgi:hypothetical protein